VFELASFAVPSILVPYPYAADDHQRLNAESVQKAGGAIVVEDAGLTGQRLREEIESLLQDNRRRAEMRNALAGWARTDAALDAADRIVELVKKKRLSGH